MTAYWPPCGTVPYLVLASKTITTENPILTYCQWKGVPIPCSAIFTVFPTGPNIIKLFSKLSIFLLANKQEGLSLTISFRFEDKNGNLPWRGIHESCSSRVGSSLTLKYFLRSNLWVYGKRLTSVAHTSSTLLGKFPKNTLGNWSLPGSIFSLRTWSIL